MTSNSLSDQPYDSTSLDILYQIGSLSPRVTYYPKFKSCHIQIEWNTDQFSHSIEHFVYYLLVKRLYSTK